MKGIKTAVKTDWKNYAIGDSRGPIRMDKDIFAWFSGFTGGGPCTVSYHVEWDGVISWGEGENNTAEFQMSDTWASLGGKFSGVSGKQNVVTVTNIPSDATEKTIYIMYAHTPTKDSWGMVLAEGGYIKVTNFMVNKGRTPMPYIDSDELKAAGGGNK